MSRRRRTRKKRKQTTLRATTRRQRESKESREWTVAVVLGLILAGIGLLIALPTAISALNPKVLVTALPPTNITQPLNERFQVANESAFSIYDVTAKADFEGHVDGWALHDNTVNISPKLIREIAPGAKPVTFAIVGFGWKHLKEDDIVYMNVHIDFRPKYWWKRKMIIRGFYASRTSKGEMEWIEVAPP